jgi:GTP-binding protein
MTTRITKQVAGAATRRSNKPPAMPPLRILAQQAVEYLGPATNSDELDKLLKSIPDSTPQVALVARSNVGKSSLVNALLNSKLAIVSRMPGRTRMAHAYQGRGFVLVDLPGYGFAKGATNEEAENMSDIVAEVALEREDTSLVLQLVDARRGGMMESDAMMRKALKQGKVRHEIVFTKVDCLNATEDKALRDAFPVAWFTSSKRNIGIAELRKHLQTMGMQQT